MDWHNPKGLGAELHGTELPVTLPIVQLAVSMPHLHGDMFEKKIEDKLRWLLLCSLLTQSSHQRVMSCHDSTEQNVSMFSSASSTSWLVVYARAVLATHLQDCHVLKET